MNLTEVAPCGNKKGLNGSSQTTSGRWDLLGKLGVLFADLKITCLSWLLFVSGENWKWHLASA